jgi:uncharacterized membrane protein YsdA (DUF1294 family)
MGISKIFNTMDSYFIIYLVIVNVYGFTIMGIDKWKSVKRKYRIPEKVLFLAAFLGGALGVYAGMKVFHHKTLHNKFRFGIPAILALNIIIVYYILFCI